MKFNNTIFAILAIFCVLLSACAVSAADYVSANGVAYDIDDGYYDYDLDDGYYDDIDLDDAYDDYDDLDAEAIHNSMILPPDYAHNESAMMNATNTTGHAAGENVATNSTGNLTASAHTMPATGNPILALLAVCAVLGGASLIIRKK